MQTLDRDEKPGWSLAKRIFVLTSSLAIVAVTIIVITFHSFILWLILPDQTIFAKGFSEKSFCIVEIGMSETEVLSLLGPLLQVITRKDGRTMISSWPAPKSSSPKYWSYSRPGCLLDSYKVRAVKFDSDGRVICLESHYHHD